MYNSIVVHHDDITSSVVIYGHHDYLYMVFIGRREELDRLNGYYHSEVVRTCAIYGRRRVGKTTLIDKFCEGKPSIRFNFMGTDKERILDHSASVIAEHIGSSSKEVRSNLVDFEGIISFLESVEPDVRTVVVMDEFPDIVAQFSDAPASFSRYIDGRLKRQNVMLVICGSSISAMVRELNDGGRPLFQRFPVQMQVSPLEYREARLFHQGLPEEERIRMYAIASGIPLYHELMSEYQDAESAIKALFLGKAPALRAEARSVLEIEVSPVSTYQKVLSVIGNGTHDFNGISQKSGLSPTRCREILETMEMLGMVERIRMYRGKDVPWAIRDGFLSFHFTVLRGSEAILEMDPDKAYPVMRERIESFYGPRFEDVCVEYIKDVEMCEWFGKWRGRVAVREDGRTVKDSEGKTVTVDSDIDVVARVLRGGLRLVLMCECKFTRRRSGRLELEDLEEAVERARKGGENIEYILFSRSGFTSDLMDMAETRSDLRLVSMDEISEWAEGGAPSPE